jgi:NAD(P)H-nitrite reductase large subunit
MNLDDPVCLCFHVSRRKIIRFIKVEKPRRTSQLSECFGAGTGCGWCRPFLQRLMSENSDAVESAADRPDNDLDSMDLEQYRIARQTFRNRQQDDSNK